MEALHALPTIIGAKICDPGVLATMDERGVFPVYCGEDRALLLHLALGGAISAAAHVRPDLFVALAQWARQGRIDQAETLFKSLKPLIRLLYTEPNPVPIKGYLAQQGMLADQLREPMMPASRELVSRIVRAAERLPAIGAWSCAA